MTILAVRIKRLLPFAVGIIAAFEFAYACAQNANEESYYQINGGFVQEIERFPAAKGLIRLMVLAVQVDAADELSLLLDQAKATNSKRVRLAAMKKLSDAGKKDAKRTSESLAPYLREKDAEIRRSAVVAIGLSGFDQIACPLALVEAINDTDEIVRDNVTGVLGLFKRFPKQATPILLAAAKSKDERLRSSIPTLLAKAAGKSPPALETLRQMFADSDPLVRNNAHAAYFQLTGDLKVYVPHLLQITADRKKPAERQTEEQKRKTDLEEFLVTAGAIQIYEQTRLRPHDLATALVDNLSHQDAAIRRCGLRQLRAMCVSSKSSFRAVEKLKVQKKLEVMAAEAKDEKESSWALWVRDILNEGPPKTAPEQLKPVAELPIPATRDEP